MKTLYLAVALTGAIVASAPASAQNLIVNGGFEASSSQTTTPTGWTNVGHSEGVIAYSTFGTPAYEGNNFYDFGGYGDPFGAAGDGLFQNVATAIGTTYALNFGLSSENSAGVSVLEVYFNNVLASTFVQNVGGEGVFSKPFTLQTLNYTATSTSTQIKFLQGAARSGSNGSNDPLIDGVSFASTASGAVPEPATWAMMMLGFGGVGYTLRRGRKAQARVRFA